MVSPLLSNLPLSDLPLSGACWPPLGAACPAPGAAWTAPGAAWTAPGPTWPPPGRCLAGVWLATARRVAGHCQALAGRRLAAGVGLAVATRRLPLQLKKKPKIMQQHLDVSFL